MNKVWKTWAIGALASCVVAIPASATAALTSNSTGWKPNPTGQKLFHVQPPGFDKFTAELRVGWLQLVWLRAKSSDVYQLTAGSWCDLGIAGSVGNIVIKSYSTVDWPERDAWHVIGCNSSFTNNLVAGHGRMTIFTL